MVFKEIYRKHKRLLVCSAAACVAALVGYCAISSAGVPLWLVLMIGALFVWDVARSEKKEKENQRKLDSLGPHDMAFKSFWAEKKFYIGFPVLFMLAAIMIHDERWCTEIFLEVVSILMLYLRHQSRANGAYVSNVSVWLKGSWQYKVHDFIVLLLYPVFLLLPCYWWFGERLFKRLMAVMA